MYEKELMQMCIKAIGLVVMFLAVMVFGVYLTEIPNTVPVLLKLTVFLGLLAAVVIAVFKFVDESKEDKKEKKGS